MDGLLGLRAVIRCSWIWKGPNSHGLDESKNDELETLAMTATLRAKRCEKCRHRIVSWSVNTGRCRSWSWAVLGRPTGLSELTPKKDVLLIVGDWNEKVGSQEIPGATGKFGLGVQNKAGNRLTEFCQENTLVIANTLFQQHKRKLYT